MHNFWSVAAQHLIARRRPIASTTRAPISISFYYDMLKLTTLIGRISYVNILMSYVHRSLKIDLSQHANFNACNTEAQNVPFVRLLIDYTNTLSYILHSTIFRAR